MWKSYLFNVSSFLDTKLLEGNAFSLTYPQSLPKCLNKGIEIIFSLSLFKCFVPGFIIGCYQIVPSEVDLLECIAHFNKQLC